MRKIETNLFSPLPLSFLWRVYTTHTFHIQDFLYVFSKKKTTNKNVLHSIFPRFRTQSLCTDIERESEHGETRDEKSVGTKNIFFFIEKKYISRKKRSFSQMLRLVGVLWWSRSEAFFVCRQKLRFSSRLLTQILELILWSIENFGRVKFASSRNTFEAEGEKIAHDFRSSSYVRK